MHASDTPLIIAGLLGSVATELPLLIVGRDRVP
jgi:hypothetical protein